MHVCLRNTVKDEYDAWLRLSKIRSVDVMAYLDPLVNGVKCTTHNFPLLQSLLENTWLFQRHPLHQRAECFQEPSCCTSPMVGGINYAKAQCMDIRCFERNKPMILLNAEL